MPGGLALKLPQQGSAAAPTNLPGSVIC